MDKLDIRYTFLFSDGHTHKFHLQLDPHTLEPQTQIYSTMPSWAALSFNQCPNCPFGTNDHPHCRVARQLAGLVETCNKLLSHEQIHVEVELPNRSISTDTTAQRALCSLLGLMLAVSGCPHTDYFKPMARFHLPFADEEETTYRAVSMYLLAQYFRKQQGGTADLELKGLIEIYNNIQVLNTAMAARLRSAAECDATVNGVVLLDLFAKSLPYSILDSLQDIRYMFSMYLDDEKLSSL